VFRLYGLREIGVGVAILAQPTSSAWLWARVAGDVLDLATLGIGEKEQPSHEDRLRGLPRHQRDRDHSARRVPGAASPLEPAQNALRPAAATSASAGRHAGALPCETMLTYPPTRTIYPELSGTPEVAGVTQW
jgi:hypothetical protein